MKSTPASPCQRGGELRALSEQMEMDEVVESGGFELTSHDMFRGHDPAILTSLYQGVATRD
jgi:hypothetical protein